MVMLLADAILYMCLALYIEIVFPGEYGVPQPWYFLCLRSTWTSKPTYLSQYIQQHLAVIETEFLKTTSLKEEDR